MLCNKKYLTVPTLRRRLIIAAERVEHKPPCSSGLRRSHSFLDARRWRGPFWGPPFSTERIMRSRDCPGEWLRRGERRKRRRRRRSRGNGMSKKLWRWKKRERKPRGQRAIFARSR